MFSSVWRKTVGSVLAGSLCGAVLVVVPASVSAQPAIGTQTLLVDPCDQFNDKDFAYSGEQVAALMAKDYASLREEIRQCQGKALTKLKKPKLKKPKVPRIPGQPPSFWAYVMGSQVKSWSWSVPLEPDPVMCTSAISGQRFTVVSPKPAGAVYGVRDGNQISVAVRAGVVDTGWGQGSDCDPVNGAGTTNQKVSFDFLASGIRLDSYVGGDKRDLRWEFADESAKVFWRPFTAKEKADLRNPRKGTLTFVLSNHDSGNKVTDTGTCMGWGSDGTCIWAHSWTFKVILVRADPMDLVYGP